MTDEDRAEIERLRTEVERLQTYITRSRASQRAEDEAIAPYIERLRAELLLLADDRDHARHWAVAYRIAAERGARISGDFSAYGSASDGWQVGE